MIAGPVCHFELVRIARRRRTFVARFLFGLLLLGGVGVSYATQAGPSRPWYSPGELTIAQWSELSTALFFSFIATLAVLVVGLTPGLVADAIASERQSKTLHHLLASRLTSAEIVLGKLGARLANVGVFPVLALPILSLLTLLGGVSPLALVLSYVALGATTYFLAGLALLVSVLARRAREAVGTAYTLTAVWLLAPPIAQALLRGALPPWDGLAHWVLFAGEWVGPPTPLGFMMNAAATLGSSPDRLAAYVGWVVGLQVLYGTLFVVLAAWQLRPAFRRQEGRTGRAPRHARRWFAVRPCGDAPVYWKEAYFAPRAGSVVRNLVRVATLGVLGIVVIGVLFGSWDAFSELAEHGYGFGDGSGYQSRMTLNMGLRNGTAVLFVVWMLWLGGLTAAGISSEREQDTWVSLLSTPLEAREVLAGKMLGPLRATGHFGVVIVSLWVIGLLAGAVHPAGLLVAVAVGVIYTAFIVALGTYASSRCQSTWRARLWTQGALVAPHVCCLLPVPSAGILLGIALCSYAEINQLLSGDIPAAATELGLVVLAIAWYFGGLALYAAVAYFLTRTLLRRFDTAAGRAVRGPTGAVVLKEHLPAKDPSVAIDDFG